MAEKIPTNDQSPRTAATLLTPDEISSTISDEEKDANRITKTILNEPAIIMAGTTADGTPGARMRIFPKLMSKPTTKVEADNFPVKTATKNLDHGEAEPGTRGLRTHQS